MAEDHAGQRLDLDITQRSPLDLGEVADLGLGKADVVQGLLRDGVDDVGDLRLAQPEAFRVPAVELQRQLAHGLVAAQTNVVQDAAYDGLHLLVRFVAFGFAPAPLENFGHGYAYASSRKSVGLRTTMRVCAGNVSTVNSTSVPSTQSMAESS